jgi:hypothetical protein
MTAGFNYNFTDAIRAVAADENAGMPRYCRQSPTVPSIQTGD